MIIYILFTFINTGFLFFSESSFLKQKCKLLKLNYQYLERISLLVSFTISVLFIALRNIDMADDTYNYYIYFKYPNKEFEYGFFLLTLLVKSFTNNFTFFLIITTVLSLAPIYWLIGKLNNKWIYIFFYHAFITYIFNFAIIRQCIAMGIMSIAVYNLFYLNKTKFNQIIIFLFMLLLAFSFHRVSLFFIPLLLFKIIKINKKKLVIIILITLIFFLLREHILNYIFLQLIPFKSYYLEQIYGLEEFGVIPFTVFLGLHFLAMYSKKKKIINSIDPLIWINAFFLYITIFTYWFPAYGRILQFGYLNSTFLLGSITSLYYKENKVKANIIILIMFMFYIYMLTRNPYHVIPYFF